MSKVLYNVVLVDKATIDSARSRSFTLTFLVDRNVCMSHEQFEDMFYKAVNAYKTTAKYKSSKSRMGNMSDILFISDEFWMSHGLFLVGPSSSIILHREDSI